MRPLGGKPDQHGNTLSAWQCTDLKDELGPLRTFVKQRREMQPLLSRTGSKSHEIEGTPLAERKSRAGACAPIVVFGSADLSRWALPFQPPCLHRVRNDHLVRLANLGIAKLRAALPG